MIILQISPPDPSLIAWLSAIVSIVGIPIAVISLYKLVQKDKDKEKRLKAIESIAITQNKQLIAMQGQVEQLSKHTSEFQNQTFTMQEANDILNKQLEIQRSAHETSENIEQRKLELEKKKHLISIRPYFNHNGGNSNANEFNLTLKNTETEAQNVILITADEGNITFQPVEQKKVKKDGIITISGKSKTIISSIPSELMAFEAHLVFSDNEGNGYSQRISRLINGTFEIDNPTPK
jgi:transcriptional regulator of heat shock response